MVLCFEIQIYGKNDPLDHEWSYCHEPLTQPCVYRYAQDTKHRQAYECIYTFPDYRSVV